MTRHPSCVSASSTWAICLALLFGCGDGDAGAPGTQTADPGDPAASDAVSDDPTQDASSGRPIDLAGALAGQDCLVVVLDALHAEALGCYGAEDGASPRIDELAAAGVRFANCWSQASWTLPSTTSLFTGLYQETHGVTFGVGVEALHLADEAVTLAELFQRAGYATSSWIENVFAGPTYGLGQGFDEVTGVRGGGTEMATRVAAQLDARDDRPRFTYVHFRRPHTPLDPPDDARSQFVLPDYDGPAAGTDDEIVRHNSGAFPLVGDDLAQHRALYTANVLQADRDLSLLLESVDLSQTLVVLLSDHGEAQGQHGKLGHNWQSYQEYVHVPFVLRHPALGSGSTPKAPVMSVDVLPTLADLFDLDVDGLILHGQSLLPLLATGQAPTRPAVFSSSRIDGKGRYDITARDARHKLIVHLPGGELELYDLIHDPDETRNIAEAQPRVVSRLKALLARWRGEQRPIFVETSAEGLDEETLQSLRELGYVGDDDG